MVRGGGHMWAERSLVNQRRALQSSSRARSAR
jgi:hypothetical protein